MVVRSQVVGSGSHHQLNVEMRQSRSCGGGPVDEYQTWQRETSGISASMGDYYVYTQWLRDKLPKKCVGQFACFKKSINQINARIDNLDELLKKDNISQDDETRYKGIKERLTFRRLVISRFIDIFPNATDITLFGWGTDNKKIGGKDCKSQLSGVICKIKEQEIRLDFKSTIGCFEKLAKKLDWQTSFQFQKAPWYFFSDNANFMKEIASCWEPIKLPSSAESLEAAMLSRSPEKLRRGNLLRTFGNECTKSKDGTPVSASFVLAPVEEPPLSPEEPPSSPRKIVSGYPFGGNAEVPSREPRHLSFGLEGDDDSLPYPHDSFHTPPPHKSFASPPEKEESSLSHAG